MSAAAAVGGRLPQASDGAGAPAERRAESTPRRALSWLEDVLRRREEGTALALFRILAGLCALYIVIPMVWTGVHHLVLVDVHDGGYRPVSPSWLMNLLGGPTRAGVDRLCALIVVAASAMTLGLGGRLTCLLTTQLLVAMFGLNPGSGGGHDRLLTNGMWLLTLARSSETLSLDCWLRTRRWRSTTRSRHGRAFWPSISSSSSTRPPACRSSARTGRPGGTTRPSTRPC